MPVSAIYSRAPAFQIITEFDKEYRLLCFGFCSLLHLKYISILSQSLPKKYADYQGFMQTNMH